MRITGYILLMLGFLWLLVHGAGAREQAGGSVAWADERLPKQETFTHRQVIDAMSEAAFAARETFPGVEGPASIMVCGGVLLDLAKRKRAQASNNVPEATAG